MDEFYGVGYVIWVLDMGYGERYGEIVKVILKKKYDKKEM